MRLSAAGAALLTRSARKGAAPVHPKSFVRTTIVNQEEGWMSRSRRSAVVGIIAAAAFTAQAGAASAHDRSDSPAAITAQGRVLLIYNCERGRYKPRRVVITCADANFRARGITWSSWTRSEARGRGTALVNDCDPNCAEGTFRRYPLRLRAFRPRETGGCVPGSLFTRLAWRFPQRKPADSRRSGTARFTCPPSGP
jgi:hypothetical protein